MTNRIIDAGCYEIIAFMNGADNGIVANNQWHEIVASMLGKEVGDVQVPEFLVASDVLRMELREIFPEYKPRSWVTGEML